VEANETFDLKWELMPSFMCVGSAEQYWSSRPAPIRERRLLKRTLAVSTVDVAGMFPLDALVLPLRSSSPDALLIWTLLEFSHKRPRKNMSPLLRNAFISFRPSNDRRVEMSAMVKTISEVADVHDSDEGTTMMKLCTDLDLLGASSNKFTETSRGDRSQLWPVGRFGHSVADRLPVGAFAEDPRSIRPNGSKSLVMCFTIPSSSYVSSVLREFALVRSPLAKSPRAADEEHASKFMRDVPESPGAADDLAEVLRASKASDTGNIMEAGVRGMHSKEAARRGLLSDSLYNGRARPKQIEGSVVGEDDS
jgi:hypothetical protein